MRTVGIIAEYNPFHTGHEYHIREAKRQSGADYAVVVMSPDFVQRGEPAIFDKHTRAEFALCCGADLVLELPVCYATGSAEYFARGAVGILDALGVVDVLCFGSETADPALFDAAARLLAEEPEAYRQLLGNGLKSGKTFPQARAEALQAVCAGTGETSALADFLATPNNILGVEYCRALLDLGSPIRPLPIRREGSAYDSDDLAGRYCSATALRRALTVNTTTVQNRTSAENSAVSQNGISGEDSETMRSEKYAEHSMTLRSKVLTADSTTFPGKALAKGSATTQSGQIPRFCDLQRLQPYIPRECHSLFEYAAGRIVTIDDLLPYLAQKLLTVTDFAQTLDISPDLAARILRLRYSCIGLSYPELLARLKTRQLTEARIRRALLHLILDIRTQDLADYRASGSVYYARILGFRKSAGPLLHAVREHSRIPLPVKMANAETVIRTAYSDGQRAIVAPAAAANQKETAALSMLAQDLYASHLYGSIVSYKYGLPFLTEYQKNPVIYR